ncbi:hypothetical protein KCU59_g40, partial [Aureobasidium melanogenum]
MASEGRAREPFDIPSLGGHSSKLDRKFRASQYPSHYIERATKTLPVIKLHRCMHNNKAPAISIQLPTL